MNTDLPYITIVIPVFNGEETIDLCLASVTSLDYPDSSYGIILVDNGSTDATLEIAQKYNITVLHEPDIKSSYAARNKGILAAKGELIAFTDADCIVTPGWLKHLVQHWDDPTIGCFAGEIEAYQPETLVEKFSDRAGILRQAGTLSCPYLPYTQTANSAYRKEVFDKVGLFVPEMTSGGDADISWRMQKQLGLKIKFIPEALIYHKHRNSIGGLYRQYRKYEQGKLMWKEQYPDYELPSVKQREKEFRSAFQAALKSLPKNLKRYSANICDVVDLASPFLNLIMKYGTYKARKGL